MFTYLSLNLNRTVVRCLNYTTSSRANSSIKIRSRVEILKQNKSVRMITTESAISWSHTSCAWGELGNDRAAGSNLRMVRPSLMSEVELLIIRAHSARPKIWTSVFLAVRKFSHCTSASNWDSKAWKFSHTERKSYACALRYVPCRILLQQFETTQMSNV